MKQEKKIYNGWAFSENETEKAKINREIYNELTNEHRIYRSDIEFTPIVNSENYEVIIGRRAGYHHSVYNILKNSPELSTNELLLLCDNGNLCFGGSRESETQLRVSED